MFDIHQTIHTRNGDEVDPRRVEKYIDDLMEAFHQSPEAQPVITQYGGVSWAAIMMDYAFDYLGVPLPELSLPDFNEILFDLFPRKVSTEPETAPQIVAELRAFWSFVQRQFGLANAAKIGATLDNAAVHRLHQKLGDPANYGMAKSIVMSGIQAGFDMSTQEGMDQFRAIYNANLLANPRTGRPSPALVPTILPPLPSVLPSLPEDRPRGKALEAKRKERKRERQARKKNRKK